MLHSPPGDEFILKRRQGNEFIIWFLDQTSSLLCLKKDESTKVDGFTHDTYQTDIGISTNAKSDRYKIRNI